MMRREAAWLGRRLEQFTADDLSPILSVGSGTKAFRATFQPWIETSVYAPLEAHGVSVLHHEMEAADGVDVVGDLGDQAVRDRLRELGVRTVLCLNVFEHVRDRAGLADALLSALPVGGLLVVTVPQRFPYHADPIDTLFRPGPDELKDLFSRADLIESGSVRCESLVMHWLSKPGKLGAIRKAISGIRRTRRTATAVDAIDTEFAAPSLTEMVRMALLSTEVCFILVRRTETTVLSPA